MFDNFLVADISGEVISSLIVMVIIAILAIIVGIQANHHDPLKKPRGLLFLAEVGVNFFDGMVEGLMGRRFEGFGGFALAIAVYLFLSFIFGLTGLPSPMTYMAVPLSLGLVTFCLIHYTSMKYTKIHYFHRYVEPFAVFLPINLISMWAPLLSLTLRLFGNAIAGWTLMTILYVGIESVGATVISIAGESMRVGAFVAPFVTPLLHAYFDLFSGLIQTTVFLSLTLILVAQEAPLEDEEINIVREGGK